VISPLASRTFLDRDFSALAFQRRVLALAHDRSVPLLERVRFVAIVAANIDEFVMSRLAALEDAAERTGSGSAARRKVAALRAGARQITGDARRCFEQILKPALADRGVHILDYEQLTSEERREADRVFCERWLPAMSPIVLDCAEAESVVRNVDVHLVVRLRNSTGVRVAIVPLPDALGSFVTVCRQVTGADGARRVATAFVWLEQVAAAHLRASSFGPSIESIRPFRVLREVSLRSDVSDDGNISYALRVADAARLRHVNPVVALSVDEEVDSETLQVLQAHAGVGDSHVHRSGAIIGLRRLAELASLDYPTLRYPSVRTSFREAADPFATIAAQDVLLHHPFDSFEPVARLIEESAFDESVLDISITLYRTGFRSRVAEALVAAAEAGRHVNVVLEMHARFDEEANAFWASRLRNAGAEVAFGTSWRKVHAKLAVITRDEGSALRRYVHVSSGNYHEAAARQYTDFGLLSCSGELAEDVLSVFDVLRGEVDETGPSFRRLLVAPFTLRTEFAKRVRREIEHARSGSGRIVLKMNTLTDTESIRLLYAASQAGVDVDLIVRGICRLRPGIPGLSDRIRVCSHVGRYLEHSRVWYFHNGGEPELFIGSADLRRRSLDSRVEVMTPVLDRRLADRCFEEMQGVNTADRKVWVLQPSGQYAPAAGRVLDSPQSFARIPDRWPSDGAAPVRAAL
jgi:polyphosphate kinase